MLQVGFKGFGLPEDKLLLKAPFIYEGHEYVLHHGSVVIAAITSCTNTSNPSVMLGAGMREVLFHHVSCVLCLVSHVFVINTAVYLIHEGQSWLPFGSVCIEHG
jgi:hypothetical protein